MHICVRDDAHLCAHRCASSMCIITDVHHQYTLMMHICAHTCTPTPVAYARTNTLHRICAHAHTASHKHTRTHAQSASHRRTCTHSVAHAHTHTRTDCVAYVHTHIPRGMHTFVHRHRHNCMGRASARLTTPMSFVIVTHFHPDEHIIEMFI